LFFQVYIGNEEEAESDCLDRLNYFDAQAAFIFHLLRYNNLDHKVKLVVTAPSPVDASVWSVANKYGFEIFQDLILRENNFEYPGFNAMKVCAEQYQEDALFLYSHSKGIFNRRPAQMKIFRMHMEILLSCPVDSIFTKSSVAKACLFPSRFGWAWHNFFWIRASYLKQIELSRSPNRHYYESVIGERNNPSGHRKCFSLARYVPGLDRSFVQPFYQSRELNRNRSLNSILGINT
jgi:hypothetical protein